RDELKQIYAWLRPSIAVPMHGEARHLRENAKLAREAGVKQVFPIIDGEVVRLAPDPGITDEVPVGRLYRDGRLIVPSEEGPVRERRKLSFAGIAVVAIVVSATRRELVGEPQIVLDGVPAATSSGDSMRALVDKAVRGTLRSIPPARRRDTDQLAESLRRAV